MKKIILKEVFKIIKGKKVEQAIEQTPDTVRYIQIEDLRNDNNPKHCLMEDKYIAVNKNDIIIAWDGANAGTVSYGLEGVIGSTLAALKTDNTDVYIPYVGKYLQSKFQYLRDTSTGATIPHISRKALENLVIPIPLLDKQRYISDILDRAKNLIDKRKDQIDALDRLIDSVFFEMFGDPKSNPRFFKIATINDIANKVTDGEHKTPKRVFEGIKLLSARNIKNNYIDYNAGLDYVTQEEYERINKRCNPEYDDIFLSCSGTIGRVTRVTTNEPLALVRSVALIKLDKEKANPYYIESYLQTKYIQLVMKKSSNQSSQANLFNNQIKKIPVVLPPLHLQEKFAYIKKNILQQRILLNKGLFTLENNYNSLNQYAFRGELLADNLSF